WLDIASGRLEKSVPELLESRPELLGKTIFPLPEWSSAQGYNIMLQFALKCEDRELLNILRSRHQVFKRYRKHLKHNATLKQAWNNFKEQAFSQYLKSWYALEFPQAHELLLLLEAWKLSETIGEKEPFEVPEEETDLTEVLLHEDFEIHEVLRESAVAFSRLEPERKELRAFALLQALSSRASFPRLRTLCEEITWFNRVELLDPMGDWAACLYWTWQENITQARWVGCFCNEDYSDLKLESYLLEYFLYELCPKQGIESVELHLNYQEDYREVLWGQNLEERGKICRLRVAHSATGNEYPNH
ncbi:MAG: hypothetical protein AAF975_07385, partial [Spirochaetota bacterium]